MAFYCNNNTDIKFTESTFRIMIVICYTEIDKVWDENVFQRKLDQLPPVQQERILAYKSVPERQLRLQGRLLIPEVLNSLDVTGFSFSALKLTDNNKLYVDASVDFNIAHAGNIVACAGVRNGLIGLDIEQTNEISINDVRDQFQENEWQLILQSHQPLQEVYRLWTRKEAVLKAAGKGVLAEPVMVSVVENVSRYEGHAYHLHTISIKEGYILSLATNLPYEEISLINCS